MDDHETLKHSILHKLAALGQDDPEVEAPQSYAVGNIENAAIGVFENSDKLIAWMKELGLDPFKGPDAVLGLGLLLTLDVKHDRRREPLVDPDFEWPEEH